ncbi:MAG: hypothetical protein KBF56_00190 [Gemmatimonadaceae bacterium]|nr:hypothetical protein [Gemmatimonadaceae bacterium]
MLTHFHREGETMTRATTRLTIAFILLSSRGLVPAAAQSARDSAGVRILENTVPLLSGTRSMQLSKAPILSFMPDGRPDYDFGGVASVLRLKDGRIIVAAMQAPEFRLFDARGRLLHALAESGPPHTVGGRDHALAMLSGDTIAVRHFGSTILLTLTGDSLRQVTGPLPPAASHPGGFNVGTLSNGGGAFVMLPRPKPHPEGTQFVDSTGLSLVDRNGAVIRDLGPMPYGTFETVDSSPFAVWLSAIGAPCAGSGRFYYGFGSEYAFRAYSERGQLEAIVRRSWTPTVVTDSEWERWVVEWSKIWVTTRGADSLKRVQRVREQPWADALPAFAQCLVARDGNLWVREAHLDDAISAGSLVDDPIVPSKWSVFNPAGRWISDVTMPTAFQPIDIGTDYVAGRMKFGTAKRTVVIYRLSGPAGQ